MECDLSKFRAQVTLEVMLRSNFNSKSKKQAEFTVENVAQPSTTIDLMNFTPNHGKVFFDDQ